ncbi:DNA-formamidopyrimidine glycosylase family protein [Streptomyces sp. MP131-18]|uniref:Fpg/Nei family DNA glycosylase n=1 Tax=Streptomyces sp. MP131-18 TaxID=1857892 RepID=UPI00097BD23C|nr:DNA-formamidopyrimidine glycosylase family protein [Streptomyces sp. MP131-18]ONK12261.1 putative formamidopyrimidine-DNA glycosylase-like protein [Streptomyces sp. MP131-18]
MPELPEVEALREFLTGHLVGHEVARALPVAFHVLKTYDPPLSAVEGHPVTAVGRHGKFLDLAIGDLHLVVHLARAGWLRWHDSLPAAPPRPGKGPLALRVALAGPQGAGFDLTEAGTQKRLAVYCVRDPAAEVPGIARLGPDPLDPALDEAAFAALLGGESRQIKGVLRDQSVLAGIGNAYSDEILHAARMSPFKQAARLTGEETAALHAAMTATLRAAVERSRGLAARQLKTEKKTGLRVHGRTGEPCPVCGDTIREVSYRDSALQYCPTCQTGGKPLADRRMSRLLK